MFNMIELADQVGATIKEVTEHEAVVIFTEQQLNAYINKVSLLTLNTTTTEI
jgi:hypothetical protein